MSPRADVGRASLGGAQGSGDGLKVQWNRFPDSVFGRLPKAEGGAADAKRNAMEMPEDGDESDESVGYMKSQKRERKKKRQSE